MIWVSGLGFKPQGKNLSILTGIWALKQGYSLNADIWDLKLRFGTKS